MQIVPTPQEIEAKFWKAFRYDRTFILGVNGVEDGHTRPMTAQIDGDDDHGPIWFFMVKDKLALSVDDALVLPRSPA